MTRRMRKAEVQGSLSEDALCISFRVSEHSSTYGNWVYLNSELWLSERFIDLYELQCE